MKIIGYDYPCMDLNVFCEHIPCDGELTEIHDMNMMGGGKIPNAIVAAARLGAETAFIGAVGNDRYGRLCKKDLKRHGVDVSRLFEREGRSSICISLVDEEKRGKHFLQSFSKVERLQTADADWLEGAGALMLYQLDSCAVQLMRKEYRT